MKSEQRNKLSYIGDYHNFERRLMCETILNCIILIYNEA